MLYSDEDKPTRINRPVAIRIIDRSIGRHYGITVDDVVARLSYQDIRRLGFWLIRVSNWYREKHGKKN